MTGLERIQQTFEACRHEGRAALVTYVMGGDPTLKASQAMAEACLAGGADILEIGVPFSDPIADGATLQRAAERALAAGTTLRHCLALAKALRRRTAAPLVIMGYLNPILAFGEARFLDACCAAGVDALIVPDLPANEGAELAALAKERGLAIVFLLAPTSTPARRDAAFAVASGFLYFVSVTGVTGARTKLPADLGQQLEALRKASPVPVVVGFGIATPAQAKGLGAHADGVVVGSAIVGRVAAAGKVSARAASVRKFVAGLRGAIARR